MEKTGFIVDPTVNLLDVSVEDGLITREQALSFAEEMNKCKASYYVSSVTIGKPYTSIFDDKD